MPAALLQEFEHCSQCHNPEWKSVFLLLMVLELVIAISYHLNDLESSADFQKHAQMFNDILGSWSLLEVILSNSTRTFIV